MELVIESLGGGSKYLNLVVYNNIATFTKLSTTTIYYLHSWSLGKANVDVSAFYTRFRAPEKVCIFLPCKRDCAEKEKQRRRCSEMVRLEKC